MCAKCATPALIIRAQLEPFIIVLCLNLAERILGARHEELDGSLARGRMIILLRHVPLVLLGRYLVVATHKCFFHRLMRFFLLSIMDDGVVISAL